MSIKSYTVAPNPQPARPSFTDYGAVVEVDEPLTLHVVRQVIRHLETQKVPDDAIIQWGFPRVYASWRR